MERLHEDCDGAARVIYTHQAKLALCFSDNAEAYEDEFGGEMPNWSQLAYCAFYRDVQERVSEPEQCEDCSSTYATHDFEGDDLCKECHETRVEEAAEEAEEKEEEKEEAAEEAAEELPEEARRTAEKVKRNSTPRKG